MTLTIDPMYYGWWTKLIVNGEFYYHFIRKHPADSLSGTKWKHRQFVKQLNEILNVHTPTL